MAIRRETVSVTTAGGAGTSTATGKTTQPVHGIVKAIYWGADAGAPATTDLVVAEAGQSPAIPVFSLTDTPAAGWYYPMKQSNNAVGGAALTNVGAEVAVADHLSVTVNQANNAQVFAVTIVWDDKRGNT